MNDQIPVGGKAHTTDAVEVLNDIQAGVLVGQIGRALTEVSAHTVDYGGVGEVTLKLKIKHIGEGCQVMVESKLNYKHATKRGDKAESASYKTPMHVGPGGSLSITPETMQLNLQNGGRPKLSTAE